MYGSLQSANFPEPYPPETQLCWNISVPDGFRVKLYFSHFDLEPSYLCEYDYIKVGLHTPETFFSASTSIKFFRGVFEKSCVFPPTELKDTHLQNCEEKHELFSFVCPSCLLSGAGCRGVLLWGQWHHLNMNVCVCVKASIKLCTFEDLECLVTYMLTHWTTVSHRGRRIVMSAWSRWQQNFRCHHSNDMVTSVSCDS